MTQTVGTMEVGDFSETMLYCINEIATALGDGRLTDPYPLDEYACDEFLRRVEAYGCGMSIPRGDGSFTVGHQHHGWIGVGEQSLLGGRNLQ